MDNRSRFVLTTVWILISRAYDAYCTYQLTPDLTHEANPLVTVIGISSWSVLLCIIGVLTSYIIYAYYKSVFYPLNILPNEEGFTLSNMIAYTYLGRKDNWYAVFYKLPSTFSWFTNYMGIVMISCHAGIVQHHVVTYSIHRILSPTSQSSSNLLDINNRMYPHYLQMESKNISYLFLAI